MRNIAVAKADYLDGYRLAIQFTDGTTQVIDFGSFLKNHPHPQHNKYQQPGNFRQFRIERGNVVWERNWDLVFPVSQLHQGYVVPAVY